MVPRYLRLSTSAIILLVISTCVIAQESGTPTTQTDRERFDAAVAKLRAKQALQGVDQELTVLREEVEALRVENAQLKAQLAGNNTETRQITSPRSPRAHRPLLSAKGDGIEVSIQSIYFGIPLSQLILNANSNTVPASAEAKAMRERIQARAAANLKDDELGLYVVFTLENISQRKQVDFQSAERNGETPFLDGKLKIEDDVGNEISNQSYLPGMNLPGLKSFGKLNPGEKITLYNIFDYPLPKTRHIELTLEKRIMTRDAKPLLVEDMKLTVPIEQVVPFSRPIAR